MNDYLKTKIEIYRAYSRTYDDDRRVMVGEEALSRRIDWALSGLQVHHSLLDLGCGTGDLLLTAVTTRGDRGVACGIDLSADMLAVAAGKLAGHRANLIQADAIKRLPFTDSSFDLVTSLNLFQEIHPDYYVSVFHEIRRVLKTSGYFRAAIPCIVGTSEAEAAFSSEAEHHAAMFFRPWQEIEALCHRSEFKDIETTLKISNAAASQAKGEPKFKLFTNFMEAVKTRGLDPNQVQQAVLLISAK